MDKVILTIELVEKAEGGYIMRHSGSNPVSVADMRSSDNMQTALYKLETLVSGFCEAMRSWEGGAALRQTVTELLEERQCDDNNHAIEKQSRERPE